MKFANRLLTLVSLLVLALPAAAGPRDLVLIAGGDVSYQRGQFDALLEKVGTGPGMFTKVKPYLDQADLRFLNLETPLTDAPFAQKKTYLMATPPHRLQWILDAGFNLLSLANNHTFDAGLQGVKDTVTTLRGAQASGHHLWWAGADPEPSKADAITYFTPPGKELKVAFLAFGNNRAPQVASFWGKKVYDRVREARKNADLVIVSVHSGKEYEHVPDDHLVKRFRGLVDAGADIVLGHHPHVIRGVEGYKGGVILYSLGNFSFASFTSRHHEKGAKLYGMLPLVYVTDGKPSRLRIVPLYVNNKESFEVPGQPKLRPTPFQPQPLSGAYAATVLAAIDEWTAAIPGNATKLSIEGDEAIVELSAPAGGSAPAAGNR